MLYTFLFKNQGEHSNIQEFKMLPYESYREGIKWISKKIKEGGDPSYTMDNFVGVMMSRSVHETNVLMHERTHNEINKLMEDSSYELGGVYV